jgi:3'(2'), 5'-bisphosphate nucleotidase
LLEIREGLSSGVNADEVRTEGDRRSHELILDRLRRESPDTEVLSEEAADAIDDPSADRLWIVDPLDGTREFGEQDRDDWAVHVALVERGKPVAGAVALPAQGATYGTDCPPPAPSHPSSQHVIRIATSRTRPAIEAAELARRMGAELVPMGSAGAKAMAVLSGAVDVYVHSGGQYVWDSAAPVAVAVAAGLHASRIDGSDLVYGGESTWLPDVVVCRAELRDGVLETLRCLRDPATLSPISATRPHVRS